MRYKVNNTEVTVLSDETLVAGSCERIYLTFDFDKSWDGYIKIATIRRGAVKFDRALENGTCEVPWEVLAQSGVLQISVRGESENGTHAPVFAPFKMIYGGAKGKDCADSPSPDVWQQLLAEIGTLTPHIGEDGYWYVGDENTGVKARGEKGDTGPQGEKGDQGARGADGYTPTRGKDYWTEDDESKIRSDIKTYVDEAILGGKW